MRCINSNIQASELLGYILEKLENNGLRYCVQRNYEGYPDIITGDVDLVVSEKDLPAASVLIDSVAYELGWVKFHSYMWKKTAYLGYSKSIYPERFALVIELFAGACWHGLEYICSDDILRDRMSINNIWAPSLHHQALITLFHHMLYNNTVPDKYHNEIKLLVKNSKEDFIRSINNILITSDGGDIENSVNLGRWNVLESYINKLKLSIIARNIILSPFSSLSTIYKGIIAKKYVCSGIVLFVNEFGDINRLLNALLEVADKWHLYMPTKRKVYLKINNYKESDVLKTYSSGGLAIVEGGNDNKINNTYWSYMITIDDNVALIERGREELEFPLVGFEDEHELAFEILNYVLTDSSKRL